MKDITREELIRSKEYWVTNIQLKLFAEVEAFMEAHKMNRTQFAEYLGCSKGYVTQLLSGDYDNKLSKLVELSLAIGKVPELEFGDMDAFDRYVDEKFGAGTAEKVYAGTGKIALDLCYELKINNFNGNERVDYRLRNYR